jgi:hypothetical protein
VGRRATHAEHRPHRRRHPQPAELARRAAPALRGTLAACCRVAKNAFPSVRTVRLPVEFSGRRRKLWVPSARLSAPIRSAELFGTINAANLKRAHALLETGKARGKIVLEGFPPVIGKAQRSGVRPDPHFVGAIVRVRISSCQSGRLSCHRHQRLRSEADSQPLLRTTSNVDAVADMAFGSPRSLIQHEAASARDNHGALTISLHAGGKPDSVSAGSGLGGIKDGSGCSVDSLNQKSSS